MPDSVLRALQAVRGLMHGKSAARESEPVAPVPEAHINAIKGRVSRQVWALVQLQLLTSARGGELVVLRTIDLDMTGRIWLYRPCVHKTAYRGRERTIYIGPQAQEVIKPFLVGRAIDTYLFSPLEAERERHAKARTHRHQPIVPPRTSRKVGGRYTQRHLPPGDHLRLCRRWRARLDPTPVTPQRGDVHSQGVRTRRSPDHARSRPGRRDASVRRGQRGQSAEDRGGDRVMGSRLSLGPRVIRHW